MSNYGFRDLSATPTPNPATGFYKVYIKNGVLTLLDDAGVETPITPVTLPLPLADGGLGTDASAFDGFVRIASGTASAVKANLSATVAPVASDDNTAGYAVGSVWIDVTADEVYICADASTGAAVWIQAGGSAGVGGSTGATDNAILRADGTGGATLQNSLVAIDDSGNMTGAISVATTDVRAATSAGLTIENNSSGDVALFGAGGGTGVTFYGGIIADASAVFNESGGNNDVRIEGDTNANLFVTDASADAIGIGTATPDASAVLDVTSTTKGFLPPRVTTTERNAIGTPAEGLLVFDTDLDSLYIYASGAWAAVGGGGGVSYAVAVDEKATNTDGGTATATTWTTRTLNTELFDPDGIVTLASNEFTLGAGNYVIESLSPFAYSVGRIVRNRIYNVTDAVVVAYSMTGRSIGLALFLVPTFAYISIASSKTFRLEYYAGASVSEQDLGIANNISGVTEIYSIVNIWKVG